MKALLAFTSIQIMVYIFSMSNAITISLIVLGSAVIIIHRCSYISFDKI